MAANRIIIEGLENIIQKDLDKHRFLFEKSKLELDEYRRALDYQVQRKKYYNRLLRAGKYNKESMEKEITQIQINARMLTDKISLSEKAIEHHKIIVDTLVKQLKDQQDGLLYLERLSNQN